MEGTKEEVRRIKKNISDFVEVNLKGCVCFLNRFSSIVKTRGIRLSFDKKQKLRDDLKHIKEMSRAIKAEKQAEKEAKKERRRANLKRTKENEKKGEVVQVVSVIVNNYNCSSIKLN